MSLSGSARAKCVLSPIRRGGECTQLSPRRHKLNFLHYIYRCSYKLVRPRNPKYRQIDFPASFLGQILKWVSQSLRYIYGYSVTAADWKEKLSIQRYLGFLNCKFTATRITFEGGNLNLIRSCHDLEDALEQITNRSVLKSASYWCREIDFPNAS